MLSYSECYATLGVGPETDWNTLRAKYRRLIGQWHPDRFSADSSRKQLAEEHCKRITLAYQALERYRREYGVLPAPEPASEIGTAQHPEAASEREGSPESAESPGPDATRSADVSGTTAKPESHYRAAIFVSVFVAATFILSFYETDTADSDGASAPEHATTATGQAVDSRRSDSGGFLVGSTPVEVYDVQGVPTSSESEVWRYGKSSIRFRQGKVVGWSQHPDNPLHLAADQPIEMRGIFEVGSSKKEVRSIQGDPTEETETVWSYGPSRVYFANGRVARWEADPSHPLFVQP